eukprot:m.252686 g.252686  ORF g.252686 m.252686 type:complete len:118 (+) comp54527_c0_seq10:421-774(+)
MLDAAYIGSTDCIRALLEFGAISTIKSKALHRTIVPWRDILRCKSIASTTPALHFLEGKTARDIASQRDHSEVLALLDEHERFLAQLGSCTKPAVRESAQAGPQQSPDVRLDFGQRP